MGQEGKVGAGFRARCACGKEAAIAVASIGRPVTCSRCQRRSVIVWGIDPKSKAATPISFEGVPSAPRGFKIPAGMFELPCPCGQRLYARPRQAGKRVQCPVCATWLKLEHGKDPQTLETRIRVVKSRLNQLPAMPPPKKPDPAANVQFILCSCGESLRVETRASGSETECPSCGMQMRLEMVSGSIHSCIVVNPGAQKKGIDETLSLDDFS
jgi:hypothetical protein